MPDLTTPAPIEAALLAACDALFAMIASNPDLFPSGERLILALLREAQEGKVCGSLLIRRLSARLARFRAAYAVDAPRATLRGPRHG